MDGTAITILIVFIVYYFSKLSPEEATEAAAEPESAPEAAPPESPASSGGEQASFKPA